MILFINYMRFEWGQLKTILYDIISVKMTKINKYFISSVADQLSK